MMNSNFQTLRAMLVRAVDDRTIQNAKYMNADSEKSFYIYRRPTGDSPQRILRLSDHRPCLQKFVRSDAPVPSTFRHSNTSVEMWEPNETDGKQSDSARNSVKVHGRLAETQPFSVDSFTYRSDRMTDEDISSILTSIISWMNTPDTFSRFRDPLRMTPRRAMTKTATAAIRVDRTHGIWGNITEDPDGERRHIAARRFGHGADYISEKTKYTGMKRTVRLNESQLNRIVTNAVKSAINEMQGEHDQSKVYDDLYSDVEPYLSKWGAWKVYGFRGDKGISFQPTKGDIRKDEWVIVRHNRKYDDLTVMIAKYAVDEPGYIRKEEDQVYSPDLPSAIDRILGL